MQECPFKLVFEFISKIKWSTARASHNELAFCATFCMEDVFESGKMWRYWKALRIAKNDHFDYPKNPINCRSTFSQCVFLTSAANPNDFGSLGTRWIVPADCFPSWLTLLVDDVELTGRIICCMLLKLGIFRNILTWTSFWRHSIITHK